MFEDFEKFLRLMRKAEDKMNFLIQNYNCIFGTCEIPPGHMKLLTLKTL